MKGADMKQEKTSLEIIAPTVEEAVSKGLSEIGLERDAVEVEVLDAGTRGLFGLGSRQARVRLSFQLGGAVERPMSDEVIDEPIETIPASSEPLTEEDINTLQVTREVVAGLLEKMHIFAKVETRFIDPLDDQDERVVLVDIQGNDLSILIGRRNEVLNALQYITSLILGKELGHWVPLLIDVQGYRLRRERQLRQIARRMAEQAIHTGRRQTLEPMPANERRIIHLELRDHPHVVTESMGEEPNRKVTIVLKK
jgi:spoIIIJ-associated protein